MTDDSKALLAARPFAPFSISMTDQSYVFVTDPKKVTIPSHGDTIHYHTPGDLIDPLGIIAVAHIIRLHASGGDA